MTKMRDRKAALKFLRKSMKRHGRPESIVTDHLRSYGVLEVVTAKAVKGSRINGVINLRRFDAKQCCLACCSFRTKTIKF